MPWLSQSLTAAQKSQQTIKAVYFQHRFYSTASTIGYRALLWRLYMPGWRHHQYPVNFSHLSEAKLTLVTFISVVRSTSHHQWWSWLELPSLWLQWWSRLHFHYEINQAPSTVKLASVTFRGEADFTFSSEVNWTHLHFRDESQPGTFSSEDGFNHLQRWSWLHLQWWSQLKSP